MSCDAPPVDPGSIQSTTDSWQTQARKLFVHYLRPHWRRMLVLGVLILAGTGLELLGPQILTWAIDAATSGTTAGNLGRLGLFYILASVATRVAKAGGEYAAADLGWLATNRLRGDLTQHVLKLPMQFHTQLTPGQLAERIDGDTGALGDFFSGFLLRSLINASILFGVVALLFLKDWRIGLIFLMSFALTVVVYRRLSSVAVPASHAERQAQSELMGIIEENLRGAEDARPLGAVPYLLERLHRAARKHVMVDGRLGTLAALPFTAVMFIMSLNEAAGLLVGVRLIEGGILTIGFVYLVVQYSELAIWPLRDLSRQLGSLQTAGASVARISDLLSLEPEDAPAAPAAGGTEAIHAEAVRLPRGMLGVRFEDVVLAYPDGPPVLKGLSFTLPPGSTLGVVGRTGGGKSSLARLLLRLYEPTSGSIVFFGQEAARQCELREVCRSELRREVSLVTQDVQLFAASVRDNLTLFGAIEDISDDRLTRVLEDAGLGPWLRQLPHGLSTPLVDGQAGLSSGQAQLLALARVFLRNPRIVLLDEASSRLDRSTQAMLDQAVDRLLAGRTAIIIAHRLSTLERVDQILVLEEGEVTEFGDRTVLAADPESRFYALLHASPDQPETQEELA